MLEDFYRANKAFVARRRASQPPSAPPVVKLAVVSCMAPEIQGLLHDALGIAPGDAYHILNAGNTSTRWDESILRSVSVAVLSGGVRHVAVVGHTQCRMSGDTLPLIDAMRKAGVPRDAFGDRDPREWFGALGGVESNVRNIVETLKRSPLLPAGVALYGLLLDSESGEIRAIVSETTLGHGAASETVKTPRQGGSLQEVLGGNLLDIQRPTGIDAPLAGAIPTAGDAISALAASPPSDLASPSVPAPPSVDGSLDFRLKIEAASTAGTAPRREPPRPPRPEPPPRANVRREPERERPREQERVPLDPREAQDFFRKRQRERERQRKKRREFGL